MASSSDLGFRNQIPSLTGVRAFAAMWIVSFHFWGSIILLVPQAALVERFIVRGNFGVDLFFMLSGFIMMHTYGGRALGGWRGYGSFLWKRFARLYPGYLAALLAMVALVFGASLVGVEKSESMYPMKTLPFEFLMIQAWGPLLLSWNYPGWSVSAEWFAYIFIFPLALAGFHLLGGKDPGVVTNRARIACAVVIAIVCLALVFGLVPAGSQPHASWRVAMEFLAGAFFYRLLQGIRNSPATGTTLFVIGGVLVILQCLGLLGLRGAPAGFAMLIFLIMMLAGAGTPHSIGKRFLSRQPWVYLGEISYALYLTHAPVQRVLKVVLPEERFAGADWWVRFGVLAIYAVVLIAAASALYHLVEHPARAYLTRKRA
jgi:peptidoglycan/LPS O-acetylase OafA/YrhL